MMIITCEATWLDLPSIRELLTFQFQPLLGLECHQSWLYAIAVLFDIHSFNSSPAMSCRRLVEFLVPLFRVH